MNAVVTLQPFLPSHLALLDAWVRRPHVAPWYPEPDANIVWATKPPPGGHQRVIANGAVEVGYVRWQYVDRETLDSLELREIPANSVDADILIGELGNVGKGVGPLALEALVSEVRKDPHVPLIGLTTSVDNVHAHRGFERAGFRILRQYDPNGLGPCHLMIRDLSSGIG